MFSDRQSQSQFHSEYAGFKLRFLASIIDFFVIGLVVFLFSEVIGFSFLSEKPSLNQSEGFFYCILFGFLFWATYSVILPISGWQATLGKKWLGLRVVDVRGRRIGIKRAIVRFMLILTGLLTLGLGFLPILFSKTHQAMHDFATGTVVVRGNGWL